MWLLRGFVPLQGRVATWSENSRWTSFALYESVWYIYIHIVIYIYYTYMIYLCNDTRVSSTNCVYTLNMKYKYTYIHMCRCVSAVEFQDHKRRTSSGNSNAQVVTSGANVLWSCYLLEICGSTRWTTAEKMLKWAVRGCFSDQSANK